MGVFPQEFNKCTSNEWYVNSDENWLTEGYNWIDPMFWRRALSIVLSFPKHPAVITLKNRCVALSFLHSFSVVFEERMRFSYKWASHFILPSDYCGIFTFSRVHKELQEYLARKESEGPRWLTLMVIQFGNFWPRLIFYFVYPVKLTILPCTQMLKKLHYPSPAHHMQTIVNKEFVHKRVSM